MADHSDNESLPKSLAVVRDKRRGLEHVDAEGNPAPRPQNPLHDRDAVHNEQEISQVTTIHAPEIKGGGVLVGLAGLAAVGGGATYMLSDEGRELMKEGFTLVERAGAMLASLAETVGEAISVPDYTVKIGAVALATGALIVGLSRFDSAKETEKGSRDI